MKRSKQEPEFIKTTLPIKLPAHGPIHLDLLIEQYLSTEFIGKAVSTFTGSAGALRKFDQWLAGRPLIHGRKVDLALYQSWIVYEHSRVSGASAVNSIRGVVSLLNWLVVHGILESDTHRLVKRPRVAATPVRPSFSIDEYERMKAAALTLPSSYAWWMLVTGWSTGQSFIDCCLLQHKNVDLDSMLLTVVRQKTKRARATARIHIVANSDFHLALVERLKNKDPHYPNNPNTGTFYLDTRMASEALCTLAGLPGEHLGKWWDKICAKAGVDRRKTFHSLRATMCSTLVNNGVNPIVACQITGHKSLSSLARYATVDESTIHESFVSARHKQAIKESAATQAKLLNASSMTPTGGIEI